MLLHTNGYTPNDRLLLSCSSIASMLFVPFGSRAINLAAVTADICCGRDAHDDPAKRYVAGAEGWAFFILFRLFSSSIVELFVAVLGEPIIAMSGVALLGAARGKTAARQPLCGHLRIPRFRR
ncbi:hypothetical protein FQ154_12265 [Paeniglutamicibacter gangotriensis]|uniref:Uncharacterized protein n=1 Tax=Paeniglutamicibacter gangotriensis TaxID=254787 RepID=A0A5B0EBP0_9MICC|nr:benzoate/H(+) symporter BenE family transporter [Paeniglutamicibacter gangotriensis]KAA0976076.1 hypothetical protein FQ154_12265 [Paeniglutamicibacter gangotriensis]